MPPSKKQKGDRQIEHRQVALLTSTHSSTPKNRKMGGIIKYAKLKTYWRFWTNRYAQPFAQLNELPLNKLDGIIAEIDSLELIDELLKLNIPIVNTSSNESASHHFPTVCMDNIKIGEIAAEHLLQLELDHFCYIGIEGRSHSTDRQAGFTAAIERQEGEVHSILLETPLHELKSHKEFAASMNLLSESLQQLPRPCGVLCLTDRMAISVINECEKLNIRIPEDLAIVGVDNDQILCELTTPNLSSVAARTAQIGYRAAELLDTLMKGEEAIEETPLIRVAPEEVVFRNSTNLLTTTSKEVSEALRYIRTHADEPIRASEVVDQVPYSRRWLENKFRDELGHGIFEEIRQTHIRLAQTILRDTKLSRADVARRSGFNCLNRFEVSFKKYTGMTPLAYRDKVQAEATKK